MHRSLLILLCLSFFACKTTTYYVSRHAEKAGSMAADPPLTAEGEKAALDLRNFLQGKKLGAVYSSNFVRTKATARPTADQHNLPVTVYNAQQSAALVDSLKGVNKHNVLIVGHSNTVDDVVNRFVGTGAVSDLPETEYGSLFIVKKKGSAYTYQKISVPKTEPR